MNKHIDEKVDVFNKNILKKIVILYRVMILSQGNVLEIITSQFGLQQIIKEPTHILDNSSYIYLKLYLHAFPSQPNVIQ